MVLRKFITIVALLLLLWAGFLFGRVLVWNYPYNPTNRGQCTVPLQGSLWTPANETIHETIPTPIPITDLPTPPPPTIIQGQEILRGLQISYIADGFVSVDGWDITPHEAEIVKYTNEFRAKHGRKPLLVSGRLMGTSRMQAWLQIRRGMHHGYTRGWFGENIAAGQQGPRKAVNAWINSSGHRANMLGNWTYIGVGGYSNQWAQQFR